MKAEYKTIPINDLKPNNYNPNEMTESQMKHLVKEIKRIGFLQPVLINKDNMIIDGYHRWLCAKEAGLTEVPVVIVDMDLKTAKTATITMNMIKGELNPIKFAELIKDLQTDFSVDDLSGFLDITPLEIENYNELLDLPEDIDYNKKQEPKLIKCPECGHEFEL